MLGAVARKYAHKIPFLVKFNHNEMLTYPNVHKQSYFGSVRQCWEMGALAVGATIYFGNDTSRDEIAYVSDMFEEAHALGMVTVLWCYTRSNAFKVKGADGKSVDYHASADLTGQADHLGATIKADIIKQKLPTNNGGYAALNSGGSSYGKWDKRVYTNLCGSDDGGNGGHPIDLCRYQLANGYMGRVPLINSGGESKGDSDTAEAVRTAIINKRAGGMGLISGRRRSEADGRGRAAPDHPGCVPGQEHHGGVRRGRQRPRRRAPRGPRNGGNGTNGPRSRDSAPASALPIGRSAPPADSRPPAMRCAVFDLDWSARSRGRNGRRARKTSGPGPSIYTECVRHAPSPT